MVQYEPLVIKIYKCIENVKTRWDNKKFIIAIVIVIEKIYITVRALIPIYNLFHCMIHYFSF